MVPKSWRRGGPLISVSKKIYCVFLPLKLQILQSYLELQQTYPVIVIILKITRGAFCWHSCVTTVNWAGNRVPDVSTICCHHTGCPWWAWSATWGGAQVPFVPTTVDFLRVAPKKTLIFPKSLICCDIQACSWLPWRGRPIWDRGRPFWLVDWRSSTVLWSLLGWPNFSVRFLEKFT